MRRSPHPRDSLRVRIMEEGRVPTPGERATMKDEPRPKPTSPHHPPTVIHHYEDDETVLARWLRHGIEKGASFWLMVCGVIAAAIAGLLYVSNRSTVETPTSRAWIELSTAKTADEAIKVAESPNAGPVAPWALLQAAGRLYNEGGGELAVNRDAALPLLRRAYDLYARAERESGSDATAKRLAAVGGS